MAEAKAHVVAVTSGLPERRYDQSALSDAMVAFVERRGLGFPTELIRSLFENVCVDGRHFEFGVENFLEPPPSVAELSVRAVDACVRHAEANARRLFSRTGLKPAEVSLLASVTEIPATPSLEARLMNRVAFRPDVRRLPLTGVGCMGGVAGIARLADYLDGHPSEAAMLVSSELPSGLWQGSIQADLVQMIARLDEDPTLHGEVVMAVVTAALFGDGSGAVLMVGRDHPLARDAAFAVIDSRSNLVPDTEHIMGLEHVDAGIRNILRPEVKTYVAEALADVVEPLAARHGLDAGAVGHWTLHPGGPRIMDAAEAAFGLSPELMRPSREALREVGNISSATVLYMLDKILRGDRPAPGTDGLLVAMGPGFAQEAVLTRWG